MMKYARNAGGLVKKYKMSLQSNGVVSHFLRKFFQKTTMRLIFARFLEEVEVNKKDVSKLTDL